MRHQTLKRGLVSAITAFAVSLTGAGLMAQPTVADASTSDLPSGELTAERADSKALSLLETVEARGDLSVFLELVRAAELSGDLERNGTYTLLVPDNASFAHLQRIDSMEHMRRFVLRHVIPGRHSAAELAERGFASTMAPDQGRQGFSVDTEGDRLVIGEVAWVVDGDIETRNGVIHVLSRFLPQPSKQSAAR